MRGSRRGRHRRSGRGCSRASAGALRDQPSLEPRSSLSREAVEIARRLGDKETLAYTLTACSWPPGDPTSTSSWRSPTRWPARRGDRRDRRRPRRPDPEGHRRLAHVRGRCHRADDAYDALAGRAEAAGAAVAGHDAVHDQGALPGRLRDGRAAGGAGLAVGPGPPLGRRLLLPPHAVRPAPRAGSAGRGRGPAPRRGGHVPRLPVVSLLHPAARLRAGARGRGAPRIRRAGRGGLCRAAARRRVALLPVASRRGRGLPATTATERRCSTGCWRRTRA